MASLGQVTLPNEIYGKTLGLPQIFGVESRDLTKTQISYRREEISHTKQTTTTQIQISSNPWMQSSASSNSIHLHYGGCH